MDARIYKLFKEHLRDDKSYTARSIRLFTQSEVRNIYHSGIKTGIAIGINEVTVKGQYEVMFRNAKSLHHMEFFNELRKLNKRYNIAIHYNYMDGMCFVDQDMSNLITE